MKRKYKSPRKGSGEYSLIEFRKKLDSISTERLILENQWFILWALELLLEENTDPDLVQNCIQGLNKNNALTCNLLYRRFKGFTLDTSDVEKAEP